MKGRGKLTLGEDNDDVQEFPEGDCSAVVLVDELEHLLDKEGVWLHGEHLGKLGLG